MGAAPAVAAHAYAAPAVATHAYAAPSTSAGIAIRGYGTPATIGQNLPYGYAASGNYVADSVGAVHVAKRSADAEAEPEADPYYSYGYSGLGYSGIGYSGISSLGYGGIGYSTLGYRPYSTLGYRNLGYSSLGYRNYGYI